MSKSTFEEKCRIIMEDIFQVEFDSVHLSEMKNPETKHTLELDLYNEKLKIALESQGQQHYSFPNYFHKTKKDFIAQVRRDDYKRKRCAELGIELFVIPYTAEKDNLEKYIRDLIKKRALKSKNKYIRSIK